MAVDRFEKDSDEEKILILHWWTRPKLEMKKQEVCEGTFTELTSRDFFPGNWGFLIQEIEDL